MFIGVKLILHALRANDLPFINGGKHIDVPEIPTSISLAVIAATLAVAAVASVYATRGDGTNEPG
jgi:tellurite resistance protein TerC